jgi:hypothetical protein
MPSRRLWQQFLRTRFVDTDPEETIDEFLAALESGLGRISFVRKNYPDAVRWYNDVVALRRLPLGSRGNVLASGGSL